MGESQGDQASGGRASQTFSPLRLQSAPPVSYGVFVGYFWVPPSPVDDPWAITDHRDAAARHQRAAV